VTIPEPAPLAIEEPAPVAIEEPAPAIAFEAAPLNETIEEISFDTALPQPPAIPAIDLRQFEEDIDLEPGAGPDPTALLVIARLERSCSPPLASPCRSSSASAARSSRRVPPLCETHVRDCERAARPRART